MFGQCSFQVLQLILVSYRQHGLFLVLVLFAGSWYSSRIFLAAKLSENDSQQFSCLLLGGRAIVNHLSFKNFLKLFFSCLPADKEIFYTGECFVL